MRTKKRATMLLFCGLLAALVLCCLTACASSDNTSNTSAQADKPETTTSQTENRVAIKAPAFTADGKNLFMSVSNDTEAFSFIDQITVEQGGTWQISTDVDGTNVIPGKRAPLNIGDNTFYLIVMPK